MHDHTVAYRMDDAVAERACRAKGATTERSRAALMGVSVSTMRRWRTGTTPPRLDVVDGACARLGVSRAELFPGLAEATDESRKTRAQLIAEAADKVVAGWPELTETQREDLARIFASARPAVVKQKRGRVRSAA